MKVSDLIDDLVRGTRRTLTIAGVKLPWPFPISYGLYSSNAMVFGRPVYGGQPSVFIKVAHRVFRRIRDARWWLMYRLHPSHRYHVIDTGLGYGYHERDDQLLHGAMAVLIGYVSDCEGTGVHDPGDKARTILHWWRVQRPADQAQYDQWLHELHGEGRNRMQFVPVEGQPNLSQIVFDPLSPDDEAKQKAMWALEKKIHQDEQKYLHLLVNIRPGMWT